MRYPNSSARCAECARLGAQRRELEQIYLTALGNLTAARGGKKEYMTLRASVDNAEIDLRLAAAEILQHQDCHALAS